MISVLLFLNFPAWLWDCSTPAFRFLRGISPLTVWRSHFPDCGKADDMSGYQCGRCDKKIPEGGLYYVFTIQSVSGFDGIVEISEDDTISHASYLFSESSMKSLSFALQMLQSVRSLPCIHFSILHPQKLRDREHTRKV